MKKDGVELHFSVSRATRGLCRRIRLDERFEERDGKPLSRAKRVHEPQPDPVARGGAAEQPVVIPEDRPRPEVRRIAVANLLLEFLDFFFLLAGIGCQCRRDTLPLRRG